MPEPFLRKKGGYELPLSGLALVELVQAVLEKGKPFRFKARGTSMHPFIRDGDIITISPLSGSLPRYGEVAAFIRPKTPKLIIHRVVGTSDGFLLIKGDNSVSPDGLIPLDNILGRVTRVERNGKRIYLGFGPERFLIAFLTRRGLLFPLLLPVWKIIRPIIGRWVK